MPTRAKASSTVVRQAPVADGERVIAGLPHHALDDVRGRLEGAVEALLDASQLYPSLLRQLTQVPSEALLPVASAELARAARLEVDVEGALARVAARAAQEGWRDQSEVLQLAARVDGLRRKLVKRLTLRSDPPAERTASLSRLLARAVLSGQTEQLGRGVKATLPSFALVVIFVTTVFSMLLGALVGQLSAPILVPMLFGGLFFQATALDRHWFSVREKPRARELVRWRGRRHPGRAESFEIQPTDRLRVLERGPYRGRGSRGTLELWLEKSSGKALLLSSFGGKWEENIPMVRRLAASLGCGLELPPNG